VYCTDKSDFFFAVYIPRFTRYLTVEVANRTHVVVVGGAEFSSLSVAKFCSVEWYVERQMNDKFEGI
jgi:hypothetical protein